MNHILQIANLITEDPDLLLEINPDFTEEPDENGDMNVDKALAHQIRARTTKNHQNTRTTGDRQI